MNRVPKTLQALLLRNRLRHDKVLQAQLLDALQEVENGKTHNLDEVGAEIEAKNATKH